MGQTLHAVTRVVGRALELQRIAIDASELKINFTFVTYTFRST